MKDIIINDKYRVDRKIGEGGMGLVYLGTDIQLDQEVAIKLTTVQDDIGGDGHGLLKREAEAYKTLAGGIGIPRVWWFGEECDFYVLVQDLLGPSLEDLFNYCNRRFSLKTILLIADQLISRMQYIHSKGFLHRDIKAENFLVGTGRHGNILYTIDFGLAKEFRDAERAKDLEGRSFGGTSLFASINNHGGREQSFKDDLECIGYMLCYFACGSLPWKSLEDPLDKESNELLKAKKMSLSGKDLCGDALPGEFATYIDYTRSLGFDDKPKYSYLRELFRRRFRSEGFKYDNIFDWTEKRFMEVMAEASR
ncbi:casein kinase 1, delta [Triangularia verruculosa]|uniref:non-specific serine/threonine protein kinase n=1 Tax=Triangularia verruculosa TaxID=2587418 RepID=A0AAN6XS30_9PEZI|nr:casein kinase 1, delta [Triangularia verruculosa]